jgi:sugar porter (SP) family MFS transporter
MTKKNSENLGYVIFLAMVAALGGFLFGYDTAVISGTISTVASQFNLDDVSTGWYVGCALVGSIIGVLFAGWLSDNFGRKKTMILSAVLFTLSGIGCAVSGSFDTLVLYRILGGVGIGVVSIISPLYISEVSIAEYRGRLVSLYQVAVTVGFLGAYLVNYALLQYSLGSAVSLESPVLHKVFASEAWRGMLGMESVPALLFFIVIFFIPESPRWLILKQKTQSAHHILNRIYGDPEVATAQVALTSDAVKNETKSEWSVLLKPGIRKAVLVGVLIAILGQFMGVNAVLYYGPIIFEQSGMSSGDSLFFQVLIGTVNMLTAVLALVIIDKMGRKKLVYYGVSGMILSLVMIGFYFVKGAEMGISPMVLLILILLYVFFCAVSICAVIWVLLSEMYPTKVRGLAMSIAGLSLWVGTYLIGQLTPWMLENMGPANTFFLFALMCLPYMYIIRFHVPDTTGKSLEDIERLWEKD